jgi:hypothetical protein
MPTPEIEAQIRIARLQNKAVQLRNNLVIPNDEDNLKIFIEVMSKFQEKEKEDAKGL